MPCRRTPDGKAYPVSIPWGNNGASLQAICSAAIYLKAGSDGFDDDDAKNARCFMHRELGYITNHKCGAGRPAGQYACNTGESEGFSYMIGCAKFGRHACCDLPTAHDAFWLRAAACMSGHRSSPRASDVLAV